MDSTTTPAKPRPSELVPIGVLVPSKTNPRSRFDEASLKELAASMAPPVGIIEPLIVRALDTMQAVLNHPEEAARNGAKFEIVAGERRWRAAKIAGLKEVPIIVRDLSDTQVLSLQVIENHQRADVHPLDEAHAIERWMKLDRTVTTKSIATAIGVSERTVQNKLRYLTLTPDAQRAFLTDAFSAGHADLLIRLSPADQALALKEGIYSDVLDISNESYGAKLADGTKTVTRVRSVREFDEWLKANIRLRPEEAAQSGLFPELQTALTEARTAAPAKEGEPIATLIEIVDAYGYEARKGEKPPFPLNRREWKEVKKGEKCEHPQRAVMVMGREQGRIVTVCIDKKCKIHWPYSEQQPGYGPTSRATPRKPTAAELKARKLEDLRQQRWQRQEDARRAQAALWTKVKPLALAAVKKAAAAAKPGPAVYKMLGAPTLAQLIMQRARRSDYAVDMFARIAKPLGVNLPAMLKAAAAKAKKPAAKKGGKKR